MEDLGKVFRELRISKNYSLKEAAATNDAGELMESQQQIDQLTATQEEAMLEWEELAQ